MEREDLSGPPVGVEGTLAWLSKCRAILVRYDKKASNYVGMIQRACALIWYRASTGDCFEIVS